jgi:hypothetical protein
MLEEWGGKRISIVYNEDFWYFSKVPGCVRFLSFDGYFFCVDLAAPGHPSEITLINKDMIHSFMEYKE